MSGLLVRTNCVHRAHHVQRGARDGHGLLIAALTALVRARHSAVAAKACGTCHAVLLQLI